MPEFQLNGGPLKFSNSDATLTAIVNGYVEAMFFTNGDTGDEDEYSLNRLGVDRLTLKARDKIYSDCAAFHKACEYALEAAFAYDYEPEQAGRDFWFTRQGHGTGFWDRDALNVLSEPDRDSLSDYAHKAGERYVYTNHGWIYIQ